jgi:hypothetical protein
MKTKLFCITHPKIEASHQKNGESRVVPVCTDCAVEASLKQGIDAKVKWLPPTDDLVGFLDYQNCLEFGK